MVNKSDTKLQNILCCQVNLQKSKVATAAINKRNDDIRFFTEPYLPLIDRSQGVVLAQGKLPRAALQVSKHLKPWAVDKFTDPDISTVSIKIGEKSVYVCSLYLDINLDPRNSLFVDVVRHCESEQIPLVVCVDTNAHSGLWGCADSNGRGLMLEEIIISNNLLVMNTGDTPTFKTIRAESIIDVTIINSTAANLLALSDWRVDLATPSHSDHRYINFDLGQYKPEEEAYRKWKKIDWDAFRQATVENNLMHINEDGSNLDECAKDLQNYLLDKLDAVAPKKKAFKGRRPVRWWNEEIESISKELHSLAPSSHDSPERWEAYRSLRKTLSRTISTAKRSSWRDFCSSAESVKEISKLINVLKPKPPSGVRIITKDGRTLSSGDTVKELMSTHFPESVDVPDNDVEAEAVHISSPTNSTQELESYIDSHKVKTALTSFGPYKAAGPDGFKPILFSHLNDELYQYITTLYIKALTTGYTPKTWRKMMVIFLPKAGKNSYAEAKSYRPITLSNFILKGLERVTQWYITDKIVCNPLYEQHAYTVGRSCDSALSTVVDKIEQHIMRKEHALVVSLDCSGAFDNIRFDSAAQALDRLNVPIVIAKWYDFILRNRRVTAEINGEKITRIPSRGSPQGGVLSPLIWNFIMDTLLSTFQGKAVAVCGYADDIILLVGGKDPATLVDLMQQALNTVSAWGTKHGLVFNPQKTQTVAFTNSNKNQFRKKLSLNKANLEYQDSLKYLGVTLTKRLSWTQHVTEKVKKGKKLLNMANAAMGQEWGLNPQRALWVYTAMVRPMITHGCLVWANKLKDNQIKKLRSLQRMALLSITKSMRSTPSVGLEVAVGMIPLHIHAKTLARQAQLRNRDNIVDRWSGVGHRERGHRFSLERDLEPICPRAFPVDSTKRERSWMLNEVLEEEDIMLFTDGSKIGGNAGAGWAICCGDTLTAEESVNLGDKATVFQAEVIAIQRGLEWVCENCEPGVKLGIRSDSQAAIQAIFATETQSKVVRDCQRVLKVAKENHRIGIEWVKGHADNTGNELADMLAKKASNLTPSTCEPCIPVPPSYIKLGIKQLGISEWQSAWNAEQTCRQTKLFIPKVEEKIKKTMLLSKHQLNLIVQVCTGHALVAHHLSQWLEDMQDVCKLCEEASETTAHLYFDCPAMQRPRRETSSIEQFENRLLAFFSDSQVSNLMGSRSLACGNAGI